MTHTGRRLIVWTLSLLPALAASVTTWQLHRADAALEAKLAAATTEQSRLQATRSTLERRQSALANDLAQAKAERTATEAKLTPAERWRAALRVTIAELEKTPLGPQPQPVESRPREPSGPHGNVYFPELFSDPHYAQLYQTSVRPHVAQHFAKLFATLGLPEPARLRFEEMLLQEQMAMEEVDGILANQAMREKSRPSFIEAARIKQRVRQTFEDELRDTFGEIAFATYRAFQNGSGARQEFVDALAVRLSYAASPLTDEQADRLAAAFTDAQMAAFRDHIPASAADILATEGFTRAVSGVLQTDQLAALREIESEIKASRNGVVSIRRAPGS